MRFEKMLARKYIGAQKRHSLLTIGSIIAAVAMMALLVTCFTTFQACLYARENDVRPYHLVFHALTEEQAKTAASFEHVVSSREEREGEATIHNDETNEDETLVLYTVYVRLEKNIGEGRREYADRFCAALGPDVLDPESVVIFGMNTTLMDYDMVDDDAYVNKIISYGIYAIYLVFLMLVLRLAIDTAFEVSSKERERQFGVLQSVGATPKQIVHIITYEGLLFSVIGVPLGILVGLGLSYLLYHMVLYSGIIEVFFESEEKALSLLQFHVEPGIILMCAVLGFIWVFLSAYGTGMRVIKLTPIQAISNRSNTVRKVKKHSLFGLLFGWEGKLAARNTRRQYKRFLITVLSLTLSISMFATVSLLLKKAEDVFEQEMMISDAIGLHKFDFDMTAPVSCIDQENCRVGYDLLNESELFQNTDFWFGATGYDKNDKIICRICYLDENAYNRLFRYSEAPPLSYAELEAADGYLLLNEEKTADEMNVWTRELTIISDEEYAALAAECEEGERPANTMSTFKRGQVTDPETNDGLFEIHRATYHLDQHKLPIVASGTAENVFQDFQESVLITTLSRFDQSDMPWYGEAGFIGYMGTNLRSDNDYFAALHFVEQHGDALIIGMDMFDIMKKARTVTGAVHIGILFFIMLFAIIAVINMVNIISTGILNRKSELAAMRCIGMTKGQLYGMVVVECLQYVLLAGILSVILCVLLSLGTDQYLKYLDLVEETKKTVLSTFAAVPRICIGTAAAFLVALAASVFSLRRIQKTSLVDQVRGIE